MHDLNCSYIIVCTVNLFYIWENNCSHDKSHLASRPRTSVYTHISQVAFAVTQNHPTTSQLRPVTCYLEHVIVPARSEFRVKHIKSCSVLINSSAHAAMNCYSPVPPLLRRLELRSTWTSFVASVCKRERETFSRKNTLTHSPPQRLYRYIWESEHPVIWSAPARRRRPLYCRRLTLPVR